ncbi:hypothetical protein RB595_006594 [Gaeumannomyces hyphopodioides]
MPGGGTGEKLESTLTAVAGVASLIATFFSVISIWLQLKNYRKPLLQRYVVRILLMVPLYSISSWSSMVSLKLAAWFDPVRDIYEAFTIYTFFQLLINYLGGERSLIIMTHGREPVSHAWPMDHVFAKADISDPYTFLAIKRGILQYAWLKPLLAVAAIAMKATGTYKEGYIGLDSGYTWSGLIYNISMTVSLYCLALFWVCMHEDLKPFRPVPKFLCIKLIIFASYWQGFFLSILVWLGAITDKVEGYSPDNLAAAIQDFLICIEMPCFAVAHWYAFSWHDFANDAVEEARMPVKYALRDAFGVRDLIEDSKETFKGDKYGYRAFDSGDHIMAHESSTSRLARVRAGMRYERGGKGKYWIPKPGQITSDINPYTPLLGPGGGTSNGEPSRSSSRDTFGTTEDPALDPDEEALYDKARGLEYGDWNYPVVIANIPQRPWNTARNSSYQGSSDSVPTRSSLAVDVVRPKKKKAKASPLGGSSGVAGASADDEGVIVSSSKKKTSKKDKGKQTASTDPGRATSPRGTRRPGVQAAEKPDLSEIPIDVSKAPTTDDDENHSGTDSTTAAAAEDAGHWDREAQSPVAVSPKYDIDEEDMRDVWGGGNQPGPQKHL